MPCPWRGHLPFSGRRKAILPAHSPNIAGVRPVQRGFGYASSKRVRIRPPRSASRGSSGTAVVARNLARLLRSDPFIRGFAIGWMSQAPCLVCAGVTGVGMRCASCLHAYVRSVRAHVDVLYLGWSMTRDNYQTGIKLCFGLSHQEYCWGALTGAGHCVMLHRFCSGIPICHEIDNSATSNSEVGTQSESMSATFTVGYTRNKASITAAPAQVWWT